MLNSFSTTRDEILRLETKLLNAMRSSDTKVLDELLHEKLLFIIPELATSTKQKELEMYRS